MSAPGAAKSNTTTSGSRWSRILRRRPEAKCRTASALNAPRRYWARSQDAQPRPAVSTLRLVGGSPRMNVKVRMVDGGMGEFFGFGENLRRDGFAVPRQVGFSGRAFSFI